MSWIGFLVGFLVAAPIVTFVFALLTSSKEANEQLERMMDDASSK